MLGPLAEAYLNHSHAGFARAFSAGIAPARAIHDAVPKLLASRRLGTDGLAPKSIEVFLQPHAPVPDRVVYLADMAMVDEPVAWQSHTRAHVWDIAGCVAFPQSLSAAAEYFRRIRLLIDQAAVPDPARDLEKGSQTANLCAAI
nr:ArsR family transcriptional regulator [Roseibium sp. RKSG952]